MNQTNPLNQQNSTHSVPPNQIPHKDSIENIARTLKTISDGVVKKKNDLSHILWRLFQRDETIIPVCKQFAGELLQNLKTVTQNFDQISSKAEQFENVVVYPNIHEEQIIHDEGLWHANLANPQKTALVNQYENMLKQQLFTAQANEKFRYVEQNVKWNEKIKSINASLNRCIEYAEKNL